MLSASQYAALVTLSAKGEMTLGELASAEGVAPPTMTRTAGHLEEAGLVERVADPLDRRIARVRVSTAGARLLHEVRSKRNQYLADLIAGLAPKQRAALSDATELILRFAGERA